jgi:transposase InsO family protein
MTKAIYMATAEYESEATQRPVKHRVSVSGILKLLGVSRSGYNAWKKRIPSDTQKRREQITQKIQEIYDESHQNYGAPKITKELQKAGIHVSEKTVGNYMRGMGIKAQWIKPFTHTTIDSDFSNKLKNILDEKFNPDSPNAVWVSDITYIWTFEGFVYLTSIMDLYSRKIISWVLSDTLEASCVVEAVEKAKAKRKITRPLVFHTDRGCQYVSEIFCNATAEMINSYSKKAYPWDNACIESFHALIKREWLNRFKIFNYKHAYRLVFEYIETFYNTVRIHSHCDYLSPEQYETEYLTKTEGNASALAS